MSSLLNELFSDYLELEKQASTKGSLAGDIDSALEGLTTDELEILASELEKEAAGEANKDKGTDAVPAPNKINLQAQKGANAEKGASGTPNPTPVNLQALKGANATKGTTEGGENPAEDNVATHNDETVKAAFEYLGSLDEEVQEKVAEAIELIVGGIAKEAGMFGVDANKIKELGKSIASRTGKPDDYGFNLASKIYEQARTLAAKTFKNVDAVARDIANFVVRKTNPAAFVQSAVMKAAAELADAELEILAEDYTEAEMERIASDNGFTMDELALLKSAGVLGVTQDEVADLAVKVKSKVKTDADAYDLAKKIYEKAKTVAARTGRNVTSVANEMASKVSGPADAVSKAASTDEA